MSTRFHPGDIVRRIPGSGFCGSPYPEFIRLTDTRDGRMHNADMPCFVCDDEDCLEWANVEVVERTPEGWHRTKKWMCHISECEMRPLEGGEVAPSG